MNISSIVTTSLNNFRGTRNFEKYNHTNERKLSILRKRDCNIYIYLYIIYIFIYNMYLFFYRLFSHIYSYVSHHYI